MPSFDIELDTRALERLLRESPGAILREVGTAVNEVAQYAFGQSQDIVPYDTGALAGSGMVEVRTDMGGVEALISYGGPAAPYALYVHEINNNYRNGKQWKYLETPVSAAVPMFNQRIRDAVDTAISRYGN